MLRDGSPMPVGVIVEEEFAGDVERGVRHAKCSVEEFHTIGTSLRLAVVVVKRQA
jgi:hypothetical protein